MTIRVPARPASVPVEPALRPRVSRAVTAIAMLAFLMIGRLPEVFPAFRLVLVAAAIAVALVAVLPPGRRLLAMPEVKAVLALLGLSIATIPISVWPGQSFDHVVAGYSKTVLLFLLLVYAVRTFREAVRVVLVGVVGSVLFLAIISPVSEGTVALSYDRNDVAFVLVTSLPLVVMLFVSARGVLRIIAGAAWILAIATVVIGASRGGFIGLVVVGALLFFRVPVRSSLTRVGFLVAVVLIFGVMATNAYWDRMATIWGGEAESASEFDRSGITPRLETWKTGIELMLTHPLGVGAGAFAVAESAPRGGRGSWTTAHNSFILVGAELGVIGLCLFVFLLYRTVVNCREVVRLGQRDPRLSPYLWMAHGVEMSVYGYVVTGSALSQGYSPFVYLLIAVSVVLRQLTASLAGPPTPTATPRSGAKGAPLRR
jgi:O-antigen ligase